MCVGLFLAYGKHSYGRIISQCGKVWTNLTPPSFIGIPVGRDKIEQSYIGVLEISIVHPPMICELARIIFIFFLRYKAFYILTNTVCPVVTVSTLIWFMRYVHYCNLQLLNNAIIVQTKVLLPSNSSRSRLFC